MKDWGDLFIEAMNLLKERDLDMPHDMMDWSSKRIDNYIKQIKGAR